LNLSKKAEGAKKIIPFGVLGQNVGEQEEIGQGKAALINRCFGAKNKNVEMTIKNVILYGGFDPG
jgi:hypothetical protein